MTKLDEHDPLYDDMNLSENKEIKISVKEKKVIPITTKYKFCNHHHEITKEQKIVDFGSGKFVADKIAIPLLKALNEIGLETRTHHIGKKRGFVGIMIDNVDIAIRKIFERAADRTKYNNKYELLISWDRKSKKRENF